MASQSMASQIMASQSMASQSMASQSMASQSMASHGLCDTQNMPSCLSMGSCQAMDSSPVSLSMANHCGGFTRDTINMSSMHGIVNSTFDNQPPHAVHVSMQQGIVDNQQTVPRYQNSCLKRAFPSTPQDSTSLESPQSKRP